MDDPRTAALAGHLAENLRFLRDRRGLTQAALARLSGVPRSTLAHLETGAGNPTLQVLVSLSSALQIRLEELLSAPHATILHVPAAEVPVRVRGRGTVEVRRLLPDPIPGMEFDRMALAAGARMTGVPHRPGTWEYLFCERGPIELVVLGERLQLETGDVAAFPGDVAHAYLAREGPAVGISVVTLAPLGAGR